MTCSFFASDYHFEIISLPFIREKLDEDKKIVILTESDLEETITLLLSKINISESEKEKILNINWGKEYASKLKKLEKKEEKEFVVFVKGSEKYIREMNEEIGKITNKKNLQIIDCYDITELKDRANQVLVQYDNILNTAGKSSIDKK